MYVKLELLPQYPAIPVSIVALDPVLNAGNRVALNKDSTKQKTQALIFGALHKTDGDGIGETKSLPGGHGVTLFPNNIFEVVVINKASVSLKPVVSFWQTIAAVAKSTKGGFHGTFCHTYDS